MMRKGGREDILRTKRRGKKDRILTGRTIDNWDRMAVRGGRVDLYITRISQVNI